MLNMKYLNKVFLLVMILICITGVSVQAQELSEEQYEDSETVGENAAGDGESDGTLNGIPVLSLTIDSDEFQAVLDSPEHTYQAENCSIRIDVPEGYESEFGEIDASTLGRDISLEYFRGRGNSTWDMPKKPFKIKLNESEDLLAMGENSHWVLLASSMDGTMMRNRLVSYMGRELGLEYTPKFVPVDFVVNGNYMGCYLLGHHVRIDKNRVDIDKIKKKDTEEPAITGGYLLALHPYPYEAEINKITTSRDVEFLIDTPDLSEYNESQQEAAAAQRQYIESYLQRTEDAIFGEDFRNSDGTPVSDLMDLESAAKYWWVQEFTNNDDAFVTSSSYLYKERDGKLYWGPLWDFDKAFYSDNGIGGLQGSDMAWLDYLRQYNPEYQELLRENWDKLNEICLDITREGGVIDRYRDEIRKSWEADQEIWADENEPDMTLDERAENLRETIENRRRSISENLEKNLTNVFTTVTFKDGENILAAETVYIGEVILEEQFPEPPEREGYYFLHWADEDGEPLKAYQAVPSDKTVHAEYISVEEAAKPEALYLQNYEVWVSLEEESYHPYYTVMPKDAIDKSVRWSVSDPELADADEEGNILLKGIGTVTVTGTTSNGKCSSFILHIEKEVDYQDVTGITPETSSVTLHPGEYTQVRILQTPQGVPVSGELIYESDNEDVAVVDDNGVILAVGIGTCVIKVQNSESDITAEYSVTVAEKEEEAGPEDPGMQEDPEKQDDPGKLPTTISPTPASPAPASPTPKGQKTQQQTTGRQTRDQKATQQTTDQKATQPYSNGKDTGSSTKSNAVNTGDNSNPFVWLLLIVCSVFIMRRICRRSY